jgi:hypothetical protein
MAYEVVHACASQLAELPQLLFHLCWQASSLPLHPLLRIGNGGRLEKHKFRMIWVGVPAP